MKFHVRAVAALAAAFAFGLFLAASPAAAECDPDTALFEDDFAFEDLSWEYGDNFYVEGGKAVIKEYAGVVNFQTQNEGANVCVDMTIEEVPDVPGSAIGLVFWWQDWDNFYEMFYWADGWLEVRRFLKGKKVTILSEESLALKKGAGATNHVEIDLVQKDATLYINGTETGRFKGKQPKDGGIVGLYGASSGDQSATFSFDNFIVSETE
jgi:hypothetical protein